MSLRLNESSRSSTKKSRSATLKSNDANDVIKRPIGISCQTGFDDLKKYTHKNNEFIRDVSQLFQERSKLEQMYSDGLNKIASKARKILGETLGTLRQSWDDFANISEQEATIHKNFGQELLDEVSKPFRVLADQQKETRKLAEQAVDKSLKNLNERRTKESHAKKNAFMRVKESENLTVQLENAREKTLSDKDLTKLDSKCKKAEDTVNKHDEDYIVKLIEAERARLNLDSTIAKSTSDLQILEEERVSQYKKILSKYNNMLINCVPKYDEIYKTLEGNVKCISVESDLDTLVQTRGTTMRQPGEQILFTCYEEDLNNTMEETRRKLALENKARKLNKQLFAERKARKGLSRLNSVYSDNPSFSTQSTQQDVGFQLNHANSVIHLLEVSMFRMNGAVSKIGHYTSADHKLSSFVEEKKDKQGMIVATLRVPLDNVNDDNDDTDYMPPSETSELDLSYDNQYVDDFDDFDDVDPEFEDMTDSMSPEYTSIEECVADYEYNGSENDELSISPGDRITIISRHDDGWWKGELKGKIGLFPASYVHEI